MTENKGVNEENNEELEEEEEDEEAMSIEEEFKELHDNGDDIRARLLKVAKTREENKQPEIANIYRTLASDFVPWIQEIIASTAATLDEVADLAEEGGGEDEDAGAGLSGDDAVQVYSTLMACQAAFQSLKNNPGLDSSTRAAFDKVISLVEQSKKLLTESYGEELDETAKETLAEAAEEG